MNGVPSSEIVDAIYRLLPGFVTAWVFYGLTAHPKASSFERVIQALIFTLFVEAIAQVFGTCLIGIGTATGPVIGEWGEGCAFVWKVIFAIALGFLFAWFANNNLLRSLLPDKMTKRTSYPSEWFSAFNRTKSCVYLQLVDDRRIFGWPEEWPDDPSRGHFVLTKAEWILPDNTRVPLLAIERILLPAKDVTFVEFEKDLVEVIALADEIEAASKVMVDYNRSEDDCDSNDEENQSDEQSTQ